MRIIGYKLRGYQPGVYEIVIPIPADVPLPGDGEAMEVSALQDYVDRLNRENPAYHHTICDREDIYAPR